jgi:multiple antibiotic resistance protein
MDWTLASNFLIALLAIANPLGKVPVWVSLTEGESRSTRMWLALLVVATGVGILVGTVAVGRWLLNVLGIDLPSFRVGGGIVILLLGISMLHGKAVDAELGELDEEDPFRRAKLRFRQVVVPMAVPMIAGPGSISTVIIYASRTTSWAERAVLAGVLLIVAVLTLAALLAGHRIQRWVGPTTLMVQTRLFGLLLTAIAAQLILEGLGEVFPRWIGPASEIQDEVNNGGPGG